MTTLPTRGNPTTRRRRSLAAALAAAVVPAYLWPALTTALNAAVLDALARTGTAVADPALVARLAEAAWTTIAIPSAAAAGLVTLRTHRTPPPARRSAGATTRAVVGAAAACLVLSGGGSALLIGSGALPVAALQFTLASAALGGGLAARRWARGPRHPGGTS